MRAIGSISLRTSTKLLRASVSQPLRGGGYAARLRLLGPEDDSVKVEESALPVWFIDEPVGNAE